MTQTTVHEPIDPQRFGKRPGAGAKTPRLWPKWSLLVLLSFIVLESLVLALALKGRWLILLAPAAVCASKALELWRELRQRRGAASE